MKFRKKPVVIEASQWFKDGDHPAVRLVYSYSPDDENLNPAVLCGWIRTLEGDMRVMPGDWIITGVNGEVYPCKPDIFAKTYEPVAPES